MSTTVWWALVGRLVALMAAVTVFCGLAVFARPEPAEPFHLNIPMHLVEPN